MFKYKTLKRNAYGLRKIQKVASYAKFSLKSLLLYVFILYVKAFAKRKDFMPMYYIYYNIYNTLI